MEISRRAPSEDVRKVLDRVSSIDLRPVISRYACDNQLDMDQATLHQRELSRYLALCTLYPNDKSPMAGKADEFWHTFLVFTALYREYCEKLAGGFIDHEPIDGQETDEDLASYQKFKGRYRQCFNEEPCAAVWPSLHEHEYRVVNGNFKILSLQ